MFFQRDEVDLVRLWRGETQSVEPPHSKTKWAQRCCAPTKARPNLGRWR